jgi:glycosyltransferase involved in cell wall biosynthesis
LRRRPLRYLLPDERPVASSIADPPQLVSTESVGLSLVLPCYRESEHIAVSVPRILRVLADLPFECEVIFVDDSSPDDTVAHLERLCAAHPAWSLRLVRHHQNLGRGAAVASGIRAARGMWVGYIDVDLEVAPDYIATCCRILSEGWDVCIGTRHYPATLTSLPRFLASTVYRKLAWLLLGLPEIDSESGYKFFDRARVLPLLERTTSSGWFWDTEIVAESYLAGLRVAEAQCLHLRRLDKTSTVKLVRDSLRFLRELIRYRAQLAKRGALPAAVAAPAKVQPHLRPGAVSPVSIALGSLSGDRRRPNGSTADR